MKLNVPTTNLPRLIIIGGGFAGLTIAKKLKNMPFQVVMIDRNNYHTFQPLLYQVATAGLEPDSIAFPLRRVFRDYKNFHFRMAEIKKVIPEQNLVQTNIGQINYDYLVIATGSQTNYFGLNSVKECGMPMKSVSEALDLRSLLLQNFEKALTSNDLKERESLMNFVIVGGGPTGVELAGALGELKNHVLPSDYTELDIRRMQIHLLEAAPRLLATMTEESSKKATHFLKELGVSVWLNTSVTDYDCKVVKTNSNKEFITNTLIWTAGVKGAYLHGIDERVINRAGRIEVDEYNRIKGYNTIFATGDVAAIYSEKYPKGHPMVAQVAIQQGKLFAENLVNLTEGKPLIPFSYKDKGSMATIGRNRAVIEISKYKSQGMFAWFIWTFVHLIMLAGFRNQMVVFINWLWSYMNYDRGMRLIIRPFVRSKNQAQAPKKKVHFLADTK